MSNEPREYPEFIPLSVPVLQGNEWKYVKECLDTNWVSAVGPFVERFEKSVSDYVGSKFAIATVNGTSALHVALRVAGVRPDDEVLVSTLSFIAPANAVRYLGAWPVFIDAEPEYWQMDVGKLEEFLRTKCSRRDGKTIDIATGRKVSAIVPVHILGHPVDMDPLMGLAREFGLVVVEDATESLGATYKGKHPGTIGDIGCFSFNGNKIVTTGGGGMIVTDREDWARKCKYLTTQAKDDEIEYVHNEIGYNYRLTNVLAGLGVAQMEVLESYVAKKRAIARSYEQGLRGICGVSLMQQAPWAESTFWMYTILLDEAVCGTGSRTALKRLAEARIQSRPLWQPLHFSPAHQNFPKRTCSVAARLSEAALSLPCSVSLNAAQQTRVIEALSAIVQPR